jgi:hypothetical protein
MTSILSHIDNSQLLQLFWVRRFQTLLLRFLLKYFHLEFMIFLHALSRYDGPYSLRLFGSLGYVSFRLLCTCFSRSAFTQTSWISTTCPSAMDGCDLLWLSGVCHTPHLETCEVVFSEVSDLSTRISYQLMDGIYFGSLPTVHRLTPPILWI